MGDARRRSELLHAIVRYAYPSGDPLAANIDSNPRPRSITTLHPLIRYLTSVSYPILHLNSYFNPPTSHSFWTIATLFACSDTSITVIPTQLRRQHANRDPHVSILFRRGWNCKYDADQKNSQAEFNNIVQGAPDGQLTVIDCYATWCGMYYPLSRVKADPIPYHHLPSQPHYLLPPPIP